MRLSISGVDLIRGISIGGLRGKGDRGEGGRGCRGHAACGGDIAALAVAVQTKGCPWWNCLIDGTSVVDRIGHHRTFAIL